MLLFSILLLSASMVPFYKRQRLLFIQHLVFQLHTHGQVLLLVFLAFLFFGQEADLINYLVPLAMLQVYLALQFTYQQHWIKTLIKYSLLSFIYGTLILPSSIVLILLGTLLSF